jgi:hypothetical protein
MLHFLSVHSSVMFSLVVYLLYNMVVSYLYYLLLQHSFIHSLLHPLHIMYVFHLLLPLTSLYYYNFHYPIYIHYYLRSYLSYSTLKLHFLTSMFMLLDSDLYYMLVLSYPLLYLHLPLSLHSYFINYLILFLLLPLTSPLHSFRLFIDILL